MEIKLLLFKNILFLSALKYPTDFNYTDFNPESISGKANVHNRDNSVADFDRLESGQSRDRFPDPFW
jgi:hypothetical protein